MRFVALNVKYMQHLNAFIFVVVFVNSCIYSQRPYWPQNDGDWWIRESIDPSGLLAVDYLHTWLQKNLVERTTEVSLQIFKVGRLHENNETTARYTPCYLLN